MIEKDHKEHNWASYQKYVLQSKDGVTSPKEIYFNNNFKLSPLVHLDNIKLNGKNNELIYYLIHTGGGYLSGEELASNIILEEGAKATFTTVSPSNIYMCKDNEFIYSEEFIKVEKDAYLTYICDDIIAFEFSRYQQNNTFKISKGAHLIYSDMCGPGWSKDDYNFSFDWIKLRSEFYLDDKPYCIDNLRFNPKELQLQELGNLENYLYMASLFVYDEKINEDIILKLRKYLKENIKMSVEFGVSKLNSTALIVRSLHKMEEEGNQFVIKCTNWIRKHLWNMEELNFKKY